MQNLTNPSMGFLRISSMPEYRDALDEDDDQPMSTRLERQNKILPDPMPTQGLSLLTRSFTNLEAPSSSSSSTESNQSNHSLPSEMFVRMRSLSHAEESPKSEINVEIKITALQEGLNADEILKTLQPLFDKFMKKIPNQAVLLTDQEGPPPRTFEYNNYGINPDENTRIEKGDGYIEFVVEGKKKRVAAPPAYTDERQVFPAEESSIFADAVGTLEPYEERGFHCFAIADGCNWGKKAQLAALAAVDVALMFMKQQFEGHSKSTTKKIAEIQLGAFQMVQEKLLSLGDTAGTTTLTLGIVAGDYLVVTRLGDSDVLLLRMVNGKTRCINVTEGSRAASISGTDPGGRLGQYGKGADWRNLVVSVVKLQPQDLIVGCTDGIHDSFDPQYLGIKPNVPGKSEWNNQIPELMELRQKKLNQIFTEVAGTSFDTIHTRIIKFVSATALKMNLFMMENPKERQPNNYEEYPGKPDHASGAIIKFEPLRVAPKKGISLFSKK